MYERVAALLPKNIMNSFRSRIEYAGITIESNRVLGFIFLFTLILSLGLAVNIYFFFFINFFAAFAVCFVLLVVLVYFWLGMASESKAKFVERVLPDALQLVSSNIKSGLTTERALFVSARPEFGPLSVELKSASKRILSGTRIDVALLDIPKKIHSKILERTIWLVSHGIASGGQIADLLMQLSDDLRMQNAIQEEIKANVSMYGLLIFFAAAFGAPVLFGISTFIVEILSNQMTGLASSVNIPTEAIGRSGMASGFMSGIGSGGMVAPEFIFFFTIILIALTSFFAALTMGVILSGKESAGFKKFPPILLIAFAIFFGIRFLLEMVFGGLLL